LRVPVSDSDNFWLIKPYGLDTTGQTHARRDYATYNVRFVAAVEEWI